ncbi:hypothetical protein U1Q18_013423 [Sarracenia purpurea var. burkii]
MGIENRSSYWHTADRPNVRIGEKNKSVQEPGTPRSVSSELQGSSEVSNTDGNQPSRNKDLPTAQDPKINLRRPSRLREEREKNGTQKWSSTSR